MSDPQDVRSAEELRLRARTSLLEDMIKHLQDENVDLRVRNDGLERNVNKLSDEKITLQNDLNAASQKAHESELADARNRDFNDWIDADRNLPTLRDLGLRGGTGDFKRITLPPVRKSFPPKLPFDSTTADGSHTTRALSTVAQSTPISPSPVEECLPASQTQPTRPASPVVKQEEDATDPPNATTDVLKVETWSSGRTQRVRKGVVSTGRRAPKRKNPDRYTDDPPPPFGELRSKRRRDSVDYDKRELQSLESLAQEAERESYESSTPSRVTDDDLYDSAADENEEQDQDEDYEEQDEDADSEGDEPLSTTRSQEVPVASSVPESEASSQVKNRYKGRPTNNQPRLARGRVVQVQFRFSWKPDTVRELYDEWYTGTRDNPAVADLERQYGAGWRNYPGKEYHAYANDWISKRLKVIQALDYFAQKQGKTSLQLADEWDQVVQGRMTELSNIFPPPTKFERGKTTIEDPLVYFTKHPKKKRTGNGKK